MSFPSAPPLSASSVAHDWSFKADFPEKDQPSEAIEDASETTAQTESTGFIKTSLEQFPDGGKSAVDKFADESVVPPPQHTSVDPLEQLSNQLEGLNRIHDESDETDDDDDERSLSSFVHKTKSRYGVADPYRADVQPTLSCFVRNRNSVYSVADPNNADVKPSLSGFSRRRNSVRTTVDPSSNEDVPGEIHFAQPDPTNIWGFTREYKVKRLTLSKPLTLPETTSIYEACRRMADRGVNVVILAASNDLLAGILTGKDIVTRVVAKGIDVVSTPVSMVMTKDPAFVLYDTLAIEALQKMIEGKFKRLPVVVYGEVIGLLDLAKCLSELVVLERSLSDSTENMERAEVVEGVEEHRGSSFRG